MYDSTHRLKQQFFLSFSMFSTFAEAIVFCFSIKAASFKKLLKAALALADFGLRRLPREMFAAKRSAVVRQLVADCVPLPSGCRCQPLQVDTT